MRNLTKNDVRKLVALNKCLLSDEWTGYMRKRIQSVLTTMILIFINFLLKFTHSCHKYRF